MSGPADGGHSLGNAQAAFQMSERRWAFFLRWHGMRDYNDPSFLSILVEADAVLGTRPCDTCEGRTMKRALAPLAMLFGLRKVPRAASTAATAHGWTMASGLSRAWPSRCPVGRSQAASANEQSRAPYFTSGGWRGSTVSPLAAHERLCKMNTTTSMGLVYDP